MKRKLNENDVPEPVPQEKPATASFGDLGLDTRLLQAVSRDKFAAPTSVQQKAIPLALQGKDVLARAKTGSGKTLAYLLPILHSILQRKASSKTAKQTSALILVPTKELANQVTASIKSFTAFCGQEVRGANVTRKEDAAVTRAALADRPDIVVATPSRAMQWVEDDVLKLDQLKHLVIDEADLLLSYDYEDDLRSLAAALGDGVQTIMVSATLQASTSTLTELFCDSKKESPAVVDLSAEEAASAEQNALAQYLVRTSEDDKFLLLYATLKLKLVTGKIIVFVADVDRAYRVKLFLEQFGIRSCVLNGELPVNSRMHVVEEFTRGVYDILITADDIDIARKDGKKKEKKVEQNGEEDGGQDEGFNTDGQQEAKDGDGEDKSEQPRKKQRRDKDGAGFTLSRGLDIRNLACVLNFDLPTTLKSYIHRVGRTARAGKTGMAVSFYVPKELYGKHRPTTIPQCANDEEVVKKIQKKYGIKDPADPTSIGMQEWHFDMAKLEGFRYRLASALRNVTRIAIREARTRELRNELINSAKLQRHFEENPDDLKHLRHDNETRTARQDPNLRHVPDYLLPAGGGKSVAGDVGFVSLKGDKDGRRKGRSFDKRKGKRGFKGRGMDPLKSLNARGKGKK